MKKENKIKKVVATVAHLTSDQNANTMCPFFFGQKKLPEKVKKLRRF